MVMGVFEKYFINSKVISYCSSNIFCMGFFLLKVHKVIYLFCRIPEDNPFNMGGSQSAEKTQSATSANTLQTQSSAQNYPSECPMHKSEAPPQSFPQWVPHASEEHTIATQRLPNAWGWCKWGRNRPQEYGTV